MAEADPQVMSMVEAALKKNPDASSQELYDQIRKKKRSIGRLTLRQFHAKYPLQVKRRKGVAKRARARARAGGTAAKSKARKAPARKKSTRTTRRSTTRKTTKPTARTLSVSDAGLDRDRVRSVLLDFATDLSAAGTREGAVRVVANVDRYVEKIASAS